MPSVSLACHEAIATAYMMQHRFEEANRLHVRYLELSEQTLLPGGTCLTPHGAAR